MKLYRIALAWAIFSLIFLPRARAQQELLTTLNQVSTQLKTVKTAGNEWRQVMRANGIRPYLVVYEITGTDKKGQTSTRSYEFNLADIDQASIKYEAKKDEMLVKMKTLKNNGFIKEKEGDQQLKYVSELTLYADQVDNARNLTEALRKSIPLAKSTMESRLKIVNTYDFLTSWIASNVISATSGGESYKQAISYVDGFKNLKAKLIQQHEAKGKVDEEIYDFNLADLDGRNIEMGISGKWVYLEVPTQANVNYIRYTKNGKVQSSEKAVRFYFEEVEKAREGKMILEKLLPLSIPIRETMKPVYGSLADGLRKVKLAIKNTPDMGQSIAGECQTVLSINEGGKTMEYRFFWGDIDESSLKIKASGKAFELALETKDRGKFIETWKDGAKSNYSSSFEIAAEDIETIRFLPGLLKQVVTDCRSSTKSTVPPGGIDSQTAYINTRLKSAQSLGKTTSQSLEKGGACLVQFKRTTSDGKSGGDFRYELSLAELDPNSVEIGISGSSVSVSATTRNKEKTIKSFKSDVPSDYSNLVKIECDNIITAREIRDALKKMIGDCKK